MLVFSALTGEAKVLFRISLRFFAVVVDGANAAALRRSAWCTLLEWSIFVNFCLAVKAARDDEDDTNGFS